jgi:hypothetical protein
MHYLSVTFNISFITQILINCLFEKSSIFFCCNFIYFLFCTWVYAKNYLYHCTDCEFWISQYWFIPILYRNTIIESLLWTGGYKTNATDNTSLKYWLILFFFVSLSLSLYSSLVLVSLMLTHSHKYLIKC